MSDGSPTVEVAVLGGGPAGCAAARLLARLGREVALIPGPAPGRFPLGESLPPSTRKPLEALGMLAAVEAAGFPETAGNLSAWGESGLGRVDFPGPGGFQVERSRLATILLESARQAGVRVLRGSAIRVEGLGGEGGRDGLRVGWRGGASGATLSARWVLDASGRTGVIARRGFREPRPGPVTVALLGLWRTGSAGLVGASPDTLIESYEDGWGWSVPLDRERRFVAAMVDPAATRLERGSGIRGMYAGELAKTRHLRELVADGTLERGPWACSATPYGSKRYAAPDHLLVGDAGSFLDPLSSFGVKKALASGWLAAVVVDTALAGPSMRGPALELFEEREREAHAAYAALAAEHYARAAPYHGTSFWERRTPVPTEGGRGRWAAAGGTGRIPPEADLAEELRRIRASERLRLRVPEAGVRRVERPTVRGTRVVLEERIVTELLPGGIRHHLDVDLLRLLERAPHAGSVPDLFEACRRGSASVRDTATSTHEGASELASMLSALALLVAGGALEWVEDQ